MKSTMHMTTANRLNIHLVDDNVIYTRQMDVNLKEFGDYIEIPFPLRFLGSLAEMIDRQVDTFKPRLQG